MADIEKAFLMVCGISHQAQGTCKIAGKVEHKQCQFSK